MCNLYIVALVSPDIDLKVNKDGQFGGRLSKVYGVSLFLSEVYKISVLILRA